MEIPTKSQGMGKGIIVAICIGIGALGFTAIYAITRNSANVQEAAIIEQQNIAKPKPQPKIGALGRLEPEGEVIKVASPSTLGSSRIVDLLVKEGETVQKGQVIAKLDSYDRAIASLAQAQAKIPERQSFLEQVKLGAKTGDIEAQESNFLAKKANVLRLEQELNNATRLGLLPNLPVIAIRLKLELLENN
jgi:HlyD family secretion protein